MKLYKELNIFEDKKLYRNINLFSFMLFFSLILFTGIIQYALASTTSYSISGGSFLWSFLLLFVFIPIHELFHGLFFKLFSESKKVKYGYSQGMFYAANPGVIYTRHQYVVIILAPFVLNTLLFLLLTFLGVNPGTMWKVFIFHTAACAGDFWYVGVIQKYPQITHCEDTETGVKFYE